MELEVELGSKFFYNSTDVVDFVTKTSNIKLHYENGKVTVDSADLEYGVSSQQSAERWNVSIRVKSVTIKSFIQYEHNIVNDKNWKTELNINLGSIFTTARETVTDYVTKDAQLELRYINGEISVYNLDSEYGNSNVTSAEQWNVKIRIKSIDINDFSIL